MRHLIWILSFQHIITAASHTHRPSLISKISRILFHQSFFKKRVILKTVTTPNWYKLSKKFKFYFRHSKWLVCITQHTMHLAFFQKVFNILLSNAIVTSVSFFICLKYVNNVTNWQCLFPDYMKMDPNHTFPSNLLNLPLI